MSMQTPRTEFAQAIKAISTERGLDADVILNTIKHAIVAAYKRDARERGEDVDAFEYEVVLDPTTGGAKVLAWDAPEVELDEEGEPVEESEEARAERVAEVSEKDKKDVTPPGFGRIAAQTAKQVIHQKIREAEHGAIMDEYTDRVGALISGMVLRFDGPNVRVDLGRAEALMPKEERVPNERLSLNQRLSFLLVEIQETPRGRKLILSRSRAEFVQKLFEREVPEMGAGSVEVKKIVRDPGVRTKMAVHSNQSGIDPVGSCVGQKGVRVQAVTNELGGERVDIIPWNEDVIELIKVALAPAEGLSVELDEEEKIAHVKAPEDQLSLAIGKDGQNARLASELTGWRIEVEPEDGASKSTEDKENDKTDEDGKKESKEVDDEVYDAEGNIVEDIVEEKGTNEKVDDSVKEEGDKEENDEVEPKDAEEANTGKAEEAEETEKEEKEEKEEGESENEKEDSDNDDKDKSDK